MWNTYFIYELKIKYIEYLKFKINLKLFKNKMLL